MAVSWWVVAPGGLVAVVAEHVGLSGFSSFSFFDERGDLRGVVGEYTPSAPRSRPSMPSIRVRFHPQECLRCEMRPSDPVRHLTSFMNPFETGPLALAGGPALSRDGDGLHAEGLRSLSPLSPRRSSGPR